MRAIVYNAFFVLKCYGFSHCMHQSGLVAFMIEPGPDLMEYLYPAAAHFVSWAMPTY